ncbi:MAG: alpha/beta hydrolase [Limisphaerales bacterium]|nr:MAG: esterase family protein [Limisphaerales bacterium]HAW00155.1 esterase [Verrucomicrobiales bacterium]HBP54756.1 esterase [Verrucomicrobiales bacterium]HCP39897.1 esterase [Verrucomicrobiales bacterium]
MMALRLAGTMPAATPSTLPSEASYRAGVPKGTITDYVWDQSKVFPGTWRQYWVYVPAQYDPDREAAVMVFQDGARFMDPKGHFRVPAVFDNLIHQGEMPVTIAIFINPGNKGMPAPKQRRFNNRSFEYDTPDDAYVRFLMEEILPEISKRYRLTKDPGMRAICGNSSGGICAFTAAWERPDAFRKVVSHIGSFVNIRGGHSYPAMIRKTERKPLRVFLQEGMNDLDNAHGNWPLANKKMEKALRFMDYDYRMVWGTGGHSSKHGGQIFPQTMRWVWRDFR